MTTEATKVPANISKQSATENIEVERNGKTITFAPSEFLRGPKKAAGIKYPHTGDISEETLPDFKVWMGPDNFYGLLNEAWRLWVQSLYNSVLANNAEVFSAEMFKEYAKDLTVSSETIEDLRTKLTDATNKLQTVSDKAMSDPANMLTYMQQFQALAAEIKVINTKLANKKRVKKAKAEDDEDSTEASATAVANA